MTPRSAARLVALAYVLGAAHAADAQSVATDDQIEEVVVTSTRRSTDLQLVAGTVEAIPAKTLTQFNIKGVDQLPSITPGLTVTVAGGNNIFLRGIGSTSTGYNEAQVAFYVDGLFLPYPAMSIYSFNNIQQIEVLKGPQGTLYGRNATGGLISVTTRDPDDGLRLDTSVGYANYNTLTENLYASTPVTDTLAANVAVYHSKQSDGWSLNVFNGQQVQTSQETGVETKLVFKPSTGTKVTASFIYDQNNRNTGLTYEELEGTLAGDGTPYLGKYRFDSRITPSAPFTAYIGSLKIEQDMGFANLMSMTGYQRTAQTATFSPAGGPGEPLAGEGSLVNPVIQSSRSFSQEFQLTSKPSDSRLGWVGGVFIFDDRDQIRVNTSTTCLGATADTCAPGFLPTSTVGYAPTTSYSGYGDATYRFFDATHLTVGLRYTDETKKLSGSVTPNPGYPDSVAVLPATTVTYPGEPYPGNPSGIPTRLHFDKLTYRFVLAQDFGDDVHAYLSDNVGFKSGAYNINSFTNPPAKPETLNAYEAGVKSEWFERRLRLNTAYFYYDYTDVQVRSTAPPALPGVPILENAASEHLRGADFDLNLVLTKQLHINGGVEYLDAKYVDFPGTSCTSPGTKVVQGVIVGSPVVVACNLAGYTPPNSPPLSGFIGFTYTIDNSVGSWSLSANDHFYTSYPLVSDNSIRQSGHDIVDASLSWASDGGHFDAQIFVKNLTNEYVYALATGPVSNAYLVIPGAPRTFGLTLGYHY